MTTYSIPDMSCGHCKAAVEAALSQVPDAEEVRVDLPARQVRVTGAAPQAAVLAALEAAGYPAQAIG